METNELRIGNLVHHETWGECIMTVRGITEHRVDLITRDGYIADFPLSSTLGILLTEDILVKAGFAKNKDVFHKENILLLKPIGTGFEVKFYIEAI